MRKRNKLHNYQNTRKVPFNLRFKIIFEGAFIWFGIVLMVAGIVTYIQGPVKHFKTDDFLLKNGEKISAVVTDVRHTRFVTDRNSRAIFKISYAFSYRNKQEYGVDYDIFLPRVGESVDILVDPISPKNNALDTVKNYFDFGNIVLAFFLFVIGMAFVLIVLGKTLKIMYLLKYGYVTKGTLYRQKRVGGSVKNGVYELWFRYEIFNGKHYKTKVITKHLEELTDEKEELLLYNPKFPAEARLLDALPVNVKNYVSTFPSFFKYMDKQPIR